MVGRKDRIARKAYAIIVKVVFPTRNQVGLLKPYKDVSQRSTKERVAIIGGGAAAGAAIGGLAGGGKGAAIGALGGGAAGYIYDRMTKN